MKSNDIISSYTHFIKMEHMIIFDPRQKARPYSEAMWRRLGTGAKCAEGKEARALRRAQRETPDRREKMLIAAIARHSLHTATGEMRMQIDLELPKLKIKTKRAQAKQKVLRLSGLNDQKRLQFVFKGEKSHLLNDCDILGSEFKVGRNGQAMIKVMLVVGKSLVFKYARRRWVYAGRHKATEKSDSGVWNLIPEQMRAQVRRGGHPNRRSFGHKLKDILKYTVLEIVEQ